MTMNMLRSLRLAAFALLAAAPGAAHAALYDVIAVQFSVKAVVQGSEGGDPVIVRESVSAAELQNLAMGRPAGAAIPDGEVLALAMYCPAGKIDDSQLVVFNKNTSQVLELVSNLGIDEDDVVQNASSAVFVAQVDFQGSGNESNGINDGEWELGATARVDAQGCPTAVKATAVGDLDVNVDGAQLDLVVPRASFGSVGVIIDTIDL